MDSRFFARNYSFCGSVAMAASRTDYGAVGLDETDFLMKLFCSVEIKGDYQ